MPPWIYEIFIVDKAAIKKTVGEELLLIRIELESPKISPSAKLLTACCSVWFEHVKI